MTRPGSDAAAWLRSAISYQIERGDVMSEDNGFVERPVLGGLRKRAGDPESVTGRLIATATNGKAVAFKSACGQTSMLRAMGYRLHNARQPDGTYLAWCERIEPVKAQP